MDGEPRTGTAHDAAPAPVWQPALEEIERSLRDASRAIASLRHSLEEGGQDARADQATPQEAATAVLPEEPVAAAPVVPPEGPVAAAPVEDTSRLTAFERVWERIERERLEKQGETADESPSARRGLDSLPQQYLVTVEDRESRVDLVSVHRALQSLAKMEDIALVSFANGVPVISVRVESELDLERLGKAVSSATDRQCEVIQQDASRLFLRLTSRSDRGD